MSAIKYYSTNHGSEKATLKDALLIGQAPDRGLYMPERYAEIPLEEIETYRDKEYHEIAFEILKRYTDGVMEETVLKDLCIDAYDYDVPLENAAERRHVMRLDRGPTCSFKDFAARMMARLMSKFLEKESGELLILTATSGDTGSAVASAFHNVPRIKILVLFPIKEVSDRQRKQMTTLGGNVRTVGVDGKFDDCQAMVKRAFADPELQGLRLSSANSINIGRLLPQSVYYFYAFSRLCTPNEKIVFSVPSGNFGDMMGCIFAWRMGLPIERLVVATNENDEVPRYFETGLYEKIVPSRVCISNAMNVGHPSNFARLIAAYDGIMDETGVMKKPADLERIRRDMWAVSINEEETRETIKSAWKRYKLLLEPHGAVGWAGLNRYLEEENPNWKGASASLETAHPAKFPEEIVKLLGFEPEAPPPLERLAQLEEQYDRMSIDYENFKEFLLKEY